MPKEKKYMASKKYNDIIYGWLQVNSEWDKENNIRWIPKEKVNFSAMGNELQLSRQTVSARFKRLLKENDGLGLVEYNEEKKRYELSPLDSSAAMLVEKTTLRKLVSSLNDNAINIFVYLLNRYIANREQGYDIFLDTIKDVVGLSTKSRTNNYIVTDILDILQKLGLLRYHLVMDTEERKTQYRIFEVKNRIEC